LENAGMRQAFTFEGKDDIEISAEESIYSVGTSDSIYIQVKSGIISESCFCKVICNWLLLDKTASDAVILFAENEIGALSSDTTKDAIFDYILK
jgi:hypothetical protein